MARISVRYLTSQPGRGAGELPRWFWQPSSKLRAEGWRSERVPLNWSSFADARQLEAAAVARANELNDHLDAVRSKVAVTAVEATARAPASRTLGDLIRLYQASSAYRECAPSTQRGYRQCLTKLDEWAGDAPVRAIDTVRVQKLKMGLGATPAYANAVVRVLRLLLAFGRHQGWVVLNVAERPGLLRVEEGGVIWPVEAVDLFVATADSLGHHSMGTAVLLNEWLGQRQGDILRMPRSVIRNGSLVLQQSKTGASVTLPVHLVPRLQRRLDLELARSAAAVTIIVSEETGRPYLVDNFRHVFARVRAKLAETHAGFEIDYLLPGRNMADPKAFFVATTELTFMALRHTAITRLAEAECDTGLIASISGHAEASVAAIIERYRIRTGKMASLAFQRRLNREQPAAAATVAGVQRHG